MSARPMAVLLGAAALAAAGCNGGPQTAGPYYQPQAVIRNIERRGYGEIVPPTTLIEPERPECRAGQPLRVTVRVIAPRGVKALDAYLPVCGRFHVRARGSLAEILPAPGMEAEAQTDLLPDQKYQRERSLTLNLTRVFPLTQPGWYDIWWAGECEQTPMHSAEAHVRVVP